jgi:hypothetical protein
VEDFEMADMQMQGNEQAWYQKLKEWQDKPENAMALLTTGLTLLGGNRPGENTGALLARGIGAGVGVKATVGQMQRQQQSQAEQTQYERGVESRKLGQKDRELGISQQQANIARRKAVREGGDNTDKRAETIRKAVEANYPLPDEQMMFVDPEGYQAQMQSAIQSRRTQYISALQNAGIDPAQIIGNQGQGRAPTSTEVPTTASPPSMGATPFPSITDAGWKQLATSNDPKTTEVLGELLARYPEMEAYILSQLQKFSGGANTSIPTPNPISTPSQSPSTKIGAMPIPSVP